MTDDFSPTEPPRAIDGPFAADSLLLTEIIRKLRSGISKTFGLAILGAVVGCLAGVVLIFFTARTSSMRVGFAFSGFERGRYPDGSTFIPDDLRTADVIADALKQRPNTKFSVRENDIRGEISVVGLVSANVIKERDRLRASGQTPPPFIPDEYQVSITTKPKGDFSSTENELFLLALANAYQQKFRRTYVDMPPQYGKAFESLGKSDYFEYELVLNQDLQTLDRFLLDLTLTQKTDDDQRGRTASSTFRSSSTGYSFNELLGQTRNFEQLRLTEVMGLIQSTGLSKSRQTAVMKMDYRVRILGEEEKRLAEEEAMIRDLMTKVESKNQSYVLGIKSQSTASKSDSPLIDQGLLDTLVQNDSFNYLVRRAVDTGIRVRAISAQKNALIERSDRMRKFVSTADVVQADTQRNVDEALKSLEMEYKKLLDSVRQTYEDFTRQELGSAIRITQPPQTEPLWTLPVRLMLLGVVLGALLGMGISLTASIAAPGARKV